jgi:predicted kinase
VVIRDVVTGVGRIVLVCGLPGAGKTTVARRLAAERGAVRMCPDEWMDALGIDLYDQPARARVEALQWRQTVELVQLGQSVVIEWGVWSRSERDTLRAHARSIGAPIELLHLDVALSELWRRVEARNAHPAPGWVVIERSSLEEWATWFEAPDAGELALFDPPPPT